jgi:ankyrin repeat protein
MSLQFRRPVLFSLLNNLRTIQQSNHVAASLATNLAFQFAISPIFQLGEKGFDHCCRLLFRMCNLGSPTHRSIAHRFCQVHGRDLPDAFDSRWLGDAANEGYYFATKSLSTSFQEQYEQWKESLEIESLRLCATESTRERLLVTRCQLGDYAGCKDLLSVGVSAAPMDDTSPSALHWLVSFSNESEIWDLALGMIDHGANLDFEVGNEEADFLFGAIDGTPLYWAVWYQNLALIQVLLAIDPRPTKENLERAIFLAAGLHFHDVLEIFQNLTESGNLTACAGIDMEEAMALSASGEMFLTRLLHHGKSVLDITGDKTLGVLFQMHSPSQTVIERLLDLVAMQNNPRLFRYLLSRLGAAGVKKIPKAKAQAWLLCSVGAGFLDVFDACFESGLLQFDENFLEGGGGAGITGLQLCCIARQRDPIFLQRFLDWGCGVDDIGPSEVLKYGPFAIAVCNGLYECANLLLKYGADKDFLTNWLGGITVAFSILLTWPDVPISRMRYLLQDLPRLGFGHINFIGWPAGGGNLLYALAMSHWVHYTASYRFPETFKYILSMMAHRDCLDQTDRMGSTVFNMASREGKLEICRLLLEAGVNPNTGLGKSPLDAAIDWLRECRKKEADALNSQVVGERRLTIRLRTRAEECVRLLQSYGAVQRGFSEELEMTTSHLLSGRMRLPSATVGVPSEAAHFGTETTSDIWHIIVPLGVSVWLN